MRTRAISDSVANNSRFAKPVRGKHKTFKTLRQRFKNLADTNVFLSRSFCVIRSYGPCIPKKIQGSQKDKLSLTIKLLTQTPCSRLRQKTLTVSSFPKALEELQWKMVRKICTHDSHVKNECFWKIYHPRKIRYLVSSVLKIRLHVTFHLIHWPM